MITKIPAKEIPWTLYCKTEGDEYRESHVVTSNQERTWYYLYEIVKGGYEKVTKSKNPNDFDAIVFPKEVKKKSKKKT